MLEEGLNAEALKLVSSIEGELSRRYARPAWLRLAKVRLELRGGKGAQAVAELKRFAGGAVSADISKVSAPSAERLSASVALLREEHYDSSVPQLLEAVYAQFLALGQYQTSYFVGLARVAFDGGDAERGDKLLRLLVALSADETKDEAASEVASLPGVSERFAALSRAETPDEASAGWQIDGQVNLALKGRGLWAEGRVRDSADVVGRAASDDPNPLLTFFRGVLDAASGRVESAANAFAAANRSQASADIFTAF